MEHKSTRCDRGDLDTREDRFRQGIVDFLCPRWVATSPTVIQLSEMLSTLPIAKQLHFSALLSEMTTEEACRAVGLPYSEGVDDASQYICIAPLIKELHNERYVATLLAKKLRIAENIVLQL